MPLLKPFIIIKYIGKWVYEATLTYKSNKSSNQTHTNILRINNLENLIFDQLN